MWFRTLLHNVLLCCVLLFVIWYLLCLVMFLLLVLGVVSGCWLFWWVGFDDLVLLVWVIGLCGLLLCLLV